MTPKRAGLDEFGRFTEPAVLILVSLAESPRHGYAISRDIERLAGHRPGPGTLYGALARLESRGFIRPLVDGDADDGKTTYELTAEGMSALEARLRAMQSVTRVGLERLAGA